MIIVLDNIRSALNVGNIFRTADGAGVKKLILGGITPTPEHIKVRKTALGAEESVDWEKSSNLSNTLKQYSKKGYNIISVELTEDAENILDFTFPDNSIYVLGNEVTGVSQEILEISDKKIYIPMFGKKNSLNVTNAASILMYLYIDRKNVKGKN